MTFCTFCGTQNPDGTPFCVACGRSLTDQPRPVGGSAAGGVPVSGPGPAGVGPAAPAPFVPVPASPGTPAKGKGQMQRTMFGLAAPAVPGVPQAPVPPAVPAPAVVPAPAPAPVPAAGPAVPFGAMPPAAPVPAAPPSAAPAPAPGLSMRTVFGMPAAFPGGPAAPAPAAPKASPPAAPPPAAPVSPPAPPPTAAPYEPTMPVPIPAIAQRAGADHVAGPVPPPAPAPTYAPAMSPAAAAGGPAAGLSSKRTVLGVPSPAGGAIAPPPPSPPPVAAVSAQRTVLGVPSPAAGPVAPAPPLPPPAAAPVSPPPPASSTSWDAAQAALAALPSSKRTMLGVPSPAGGIEVAGQVSAMPAPGEAPAPAAEPPAPPKVEVAPVAFGPPAESGPTKSRLAATQVDRESFIGGPARSRAGLVTAIVVGLLAAIGIVLVLVFRDELFGAGEAPARAGDGAAGGTAGAARPGTPAPPPAAPPQIAAKLVWSGDGSSIELEFGQIVSERPVREIRLGAGPKAGTPDAVVRPGARVPLSDFLESGAEPAPGTVRVPLDVTFGDGTTQRIENVLTVPYTFRAALDAGAAEPTIVLTFRLATPEGRTLLVAGTEVAVAADGSATWRSPVEALRGREGVYAEKSSRIDLTLPFAVRDGAGVVAEGTATASVPVVPLRVDFPGDGSRTTDAAVWVRGETAPGASLMLDGAAVTVADNGVFAVEVPLAADATRTLELRASRAGAAARVATVTVTRTTAAALARAADEWAAALTERLGYADFGAAADSFRGRKVELLGRISSVPATREGVSSFVMYVDTESGCPAAEVCAVMVHVSTAQALSERDRVRVLGEILGREKTTSEKFPELPAIRAAFVVPR